jgi:UPF0288 family protein (methanogenesis marker protein 3)
MTTAKNVGIWMDNATAHLIEHGKETTEIKTIHSRFTHQEKEKSFRKGESLMHNKERQLQAEYYKDLGEAILHYENVLLFGPTNAKIELMHSLQENHHFDAIKIEAKNAEQMTDNQEIAFVKNYFSRIE